MDKVVLRTALSTLAAILALFGVMLLLLCFLYPSTMMQLTYDLGMEQASMKYAERAYNRTDDVYYAAFGFETAIGENDDTNVEKFGLLMLAEDEEFFTYCESRNETLDTTKITYDQYAYGQLSVAQYRLNKKTEAVETAFSGLNGTFKRNNAVVALLLQALAAQDVDTIVFIRENMEDLQGTLGTDAEEAYLLDALSLCGQNG